MLDYTELKEEGGLVLWPPMKELPSIKLLEGDPIRSGRFDVGNFCTRTMIGICECTPGKFEYTCPADEICTLLRGRIQLICEDGKVHD